MQRRRASSGPSGVTLADRPIPLAAPVRRRNGERPGSTEPVGGDDNDGAAGTAPSTADATAGSVPHSLAIGGMTCGSCAARIERHLNAMPGVEARVNFATERATVAAPAAISTTRLVEEIASIGYVAHPVGGVGQEHGDARATPEDDVGRRVRSLRRRLVVAAVVFMPLCDMSIAFSLVPSARFPGWQWILVVLAAPVVTWAAWPFHEAAIRHARHRTSTMDTLVSLGVVSATVWSLYAMFADDTSTAGRSLGYVLTHHSGGSIYLDVAAGVTTFLLAGRYVEARSRQRSGDALRALAAVAAKEVTVVGDDGAEHLAPVSVLRPGMLFAVRPGEKVATDGEVVGGRCAIDSSVMTGESTPVDVGPGERVIGGTVSLGGRILVRATRVGPDTQLGHMLALVERAQQEKANVQRLADRVSAVFVPVVIVLALVTLGGWLLAGAGAQNALNAGLSVLIIACPCALGLATPAALYVASGTGARHGIFFKGYRALEASRSVDTVVLDKTGTLTEGRMAVVDLVCAPGVERSELLEAAGSLEAASEHPVGRAIASAAERELGALSPVEDFAAVAGLGASGTVRGERISAGRAALQGAEMPEVVGQPCRAWEDLGRTVVVVWRAGVVLGAFAVADTIRPGAPSAIARLQRLGLRCVLLSGDNRPTARAVAAEVGIDDVVAEALPAEKVAVVRTLQAEGHRVAMVGDGVNDAPALATADLGLAVGSGTDVAIDAADIIIVRDDLGVVATAISLARRTLRTIRSNLVWAFAYNLVAIPIAALGLLDPLIAAGAMALSSGFVVWNSSRLRRVDGA